MLTIYIAMLDNEADRVKIACIYEEFKAEMLIRATQVAGNKTLAEDAVHNAFLSIIKHKDKLFLLPSKELRSQLLIITKNKCIDLLRQKNYFTDDSMDDMKITIESDDLPIEDSVILTDTYENIKKHIASLDEQSRLVLEMKYVLDMTYKEIGEEMGITAKHVDTKIMRAKNKVRKLINMEGASDDK